jgi:hypothetical protein
MTKQERIELYKRMIEAHGIDVVLEFLMDVIDGERKRANNALSSPSATMTTNP